MYFVHLGDNVFLILWGADKESTRWVRHQPTTHDYRQRTYTSVDPITCGFCFGSLANSVTTANGSLEPYPKPATFLSPWACNSNLTLMGASDISKSVLALLYLELSCFWFWTRKERECQVQFVVIYLPDSCLSTVVVEYFIDTNLHSCTSRHGNNA